MEDLDHPKVKPYTKEEALDDLRWLGLDWDEGPDTGGPYAPYTQSGRSKRYESALQILIDKKMVYPCICTRKELENINSAPHLEDYGPKYPGLCRDRFTTYCEAAQKTSAERSPAWRFKSPDYEVSFADRFAGQQSENVSKKTGDFIIARDRAGAGYQLAVVVDDAAMGVTEVIRGDDLLECTHWQILLYRALELDIPAFTHLPLLIGPDGKRLAKRHGDARISILRKRGDSPDTLTGLLAYWSGLADFGEKISAHQLIDRFDLSKIPNKPVTVENKQKKILGLPLN
jgi:glutamyl-tRNA synthetase